MATIDLGGVDRRDLGDDHLHPRVDGAQNRAWPPGIGAAPDADPRRITPVWPESQTRAARLSSCCSVGMIRPRGFGQANAALDPAFHTPTTYGGWGQISYFFTDKLFINGWFGYTRNNLSYYYGNGFANIGGFGLGGQAAAVNANAVQNTTQMILNLSYDVNAAIRFGLEGAMFNTRYAGYTFATGENVRIAGVPTQQKDGTYYTVRVGAFYFF